MRLLVLDFETYYDPKDYTLKKMTTEEYIRDSRFEALLLGVVNADSKTKFWVPREQIQDYLNSEEQENVAVIAHHAQFDGLILSHHFNFRPKFWFDTLGMAAFVHGASQKVSLAELAKLYGLEGKSVPYDLFAGKRWHQLDDWTRNTLGAGCVHDCEITLDIFEQLVSQVPEVELQIIDTTIRMFTEPVLEGDLNMFREICHFEANAKADAMHKISVSKTDLSSADKFCKLLEAEGVEIQYKTTPKGKQAPAIAKTDDFMRELLECGNARVEALCEARIGAKSTLNETRSGRLLRMTERGPMCVYLKYAAAHTLRWGGGDNANWQNFPRQDLKPGVGLRRAITAPPGYKLVVIDLAQIECRILLTLAGQWDQVEAFREGRDLYAEMASEMYGRTITKKDNPQERDLGKVLVLQCGFGSGWFKLQSTLKLGAMGGAPLLLSEEEAKAGISTYRRKTDRVANKQDGYWKQCKDLLPLIAGGGTHQFGPFWIEDKKVFAPTGAFINYSSLVYEFDEKTGTKEWVFYKKGKTRVRMYGALLTENLVQFLARTIIGNAMVRVKEEGVRALWITHDDMVFCVPEEVAEAVLEFVTAVCLETPDFLPELPLGAEGRICDRYKE